MWISTNKLAIRSVIAYYMDRNGALEEVKLEFNKIDCLFSSPNECQFRLLGQESRCCSKTFHTFEGLSSSFCAHQQSFTRKCNRQCFFKLVDDSGTESNHWWLQYSLACNERTHTMHGVSHSPGFGCIREQFQTQKPHLILRSPRQRSAIWREW